MSTERLVGTDRVVVDDRTFADLLALALEDVPSSSAGEWTLHGAVDPGVTLLDAFAWQLEQRLYMGDQLTEPIVRASLRLLGIDGPHPARPATTALVITRPGVDQPLPAGTVLALAGDIEGRHMATTEDVWVLPVVATGVEGRLLEPGDLLDVELTADEPVPGAAELSLLVEVVAAPGVAHEWDAARDADTVEVPPAVELRWTAIGADGSSSDVTVVDGTAALRRTGIVTLPWPAVWDAAGPEDRVLRLAVLDGRFTEPVRVGPVHTNAVVAEHRVPETHDVSDPLRGFLPLPAQRIRVPHAAGRLCDAPGDVELTLTERDGAEHTWRGVRSWVGAGPGDRVFLVDRERGEIAFGDGQVGRILRPAEDPGAVLRVHVGSGTTGSVAPWREWVAADGAATATNPLATEGRDPEPTAISIQRAAGELARPHRTVTVTDAEQLALIPGVARAHARPGAHPGFPCNEIPGALSVTIVPHAERETPSSGWTPAPEPDRGLLAAVRGRLDRGRLLGQEVVALPPTYRRITVEVELSAHSRSATIDTAVRDALRRHLDPRVGGSAGTGWPFGGTVRPSALVGIVQSGAGPEVTVEDLRVALDGGPASSCHDLPIGPAELVWLAELRVRWTATTPEGGGLR